MNGQTYPGSFNPLARSGDGIGDQVFGTLVDQNGKPVMSPDGSVHISVDADFSSLLPAGGKFFNITHFESRPVAMYLSELKPDAEGRLTIVSTRPTRRLPTASAFPTCSRPPTSTPTAPAPRASPRRMPRDASNASR